MASSFDVKRGEVVTLLGRNGAGKTTTLKSIMGIIKERSGSIRFNGTEMISRPSYEIARLGVAYCPEERGIFASLSVEENLLLPPVVQPGGMSVDEIFVLFPNIKERRRSVGTKLSGGEQQMLAIARILRTGATLLLLDEPTEGLAPVIVQQIARAIRRLNQQGFHDPAGRTKLSLCRNCRRPPLHHGERPDRRRHRQHGSRKQHQQTARLPGLVTVHRQTEGAPVMARLKLSLFAVATAAGLSMLTYPAVPAPDGPVKIGVINDQSSIYADLSGMGGVTAARMAIEDFGGKVLGKPIELVYADHQNKPDVATNIVNRWLDVENVDLVSDLPNSSAMLAVQEILRQKKKALVIVSTGATSDFTGSQVLALRHPLDL